MSWDYEERNEIVTQSFECKDNAFGINQTDACASESVSFDIESTTNISLDAMRLGLTATNVTSDRSVSVQSFRSAIGTQDYFVPWEVSWEVTGTASCTANTLNIVEKCRLSSFSQVDIDLALSITYTYEVAPPPPPMEPVPLPAGAPLMLAAIGAFAWVRRRR